MFACGDNMLTLLMSGRESARKQGSDTGLSRENQPEGIDWELLVCAARSGEILTSVPTNSDVALSCAVHTS